MSHFAHRLTPAFTLLAALLSAGTGHAAVNPDATQPPSRMALRDACKDADQELQRHLGRLVAQRGLDAPVRIEMELQGSRIGAVSVAGGSAVDRQDIRRAVRRMNCDSGRAERQMVSFELNFSSEDAPGRAGG